MVSTRPMGVSAAGGCRDASVQIRNRVNLPNDPAPFHRPIKREMPHPNAITLGLIPHARARPAVLVVNARHHRAKHNSRFLDHIVWPLLSKSRECVFSRLLCCNESTRNDPALWATTTCKAALSGQTAGHCAGNDEAGRFLAAVFFGLFDHLVNGILDGLGKFFQSFPKRRCFDGRGDRQRPHLGDDLRGADVLDGTANVVRAIGFDRDEPPNGGDAQIRNGFFSIEVVLIDFDLVEWQLVVHEILRGKTVENRGQASPTRKRRQYRARGKIVQTVKKA